MKEILEELSKELKLMTFYRFVEMPIDEGKKACKEGLFSPGYLNFREELIDLMQKTYGLNLKKDPYGKLLRFHWGSADIKIDGKNCRYFLSLTKHGVKPKWLSASLSNLLKFKISIPSERVVHFIDEIREDTLVVEANWENGALYGNIEDEYTFLGYVIPPNFIKGFYYHDINLPIRNTPNCFLNAFFKNPSFNPFEKKELKVKWCEI